MTIKDFQEGFTMVNLTSRISPHRDHLSSAENKNSDFLKWGMSDQSQRQRRWQKRQYEVKDCQKWTKSDWKVKEKEHGKSARQRASLDVPAQRKRLEVKHAFEEWVTCCSATASWAVLEHEKETAGADTYVTEISRKIWNRIEGRERAESLRGNRDGGLNWTALK